MQAYMYLVTLLVTLQCSVIVAGSDIITTTESQIHSESVLQQTENSNQLTNFDNNLKTSDTEQINEIEPNVAATTETDTETVSEESTPIDRDSQQKVEKNLLTIFGLSKRPKPIDRSKVVIPEELKKLYADLTGDELYESINLPKPGQFTKSANTVRSFTHEGMYN